MRCSIENPASVRTVVSSLTFLLLTGILICSCEKETKIPFGYDPEFDYLAILRASPPYAYEPTDGYPEFKYQKADHDSLKKLRIHYKLDSLAGDGSELDMIMSLFGLGS